MDFRKRTTILIVGGVLTSGLFMFLGVREMVKDEELPQATVANTISVGDSIVARASRPIAVGETITGEMVVNVPFDPARHATIATPSELVGKVAIREIPANALVSRTWVDLKSNLAIRVPLGRRAVSIDTNAEIAVAGLLRPGDIVDVQVVYPGADAITGARLEGRSRTETVLQAVQVLAVGETVLGADSERGIGAGEPAPARTVTLALTPEEVAAFSLAKNTGVIMLSLRNPDDDSFAPPFELASDAAPRSEPLFEAVPPPAPSSRRVRAVRPVSRRENGTGGKVELIIGDERKTLNSESK
jgi:pilus assembly protein CpaB